MSDNRPTDLSDPAELLAAIPAMLGFIPTESLLIIHGTEDGVMEGAIRTEIDAPTDELARIAEAINDRSRENGMCVVILITPTPSKALSCLDRMMDVLDVPVHEILACPSIEPGSEFINPMHASTRGQIPDWRDSIMTTMQVSKGHRVFENERQIDQLYAPDESAEATSVLSLQECANHVALLGTSLFNEGEPPPPSIQQLASVLVYGQNARDMCAFLAMQKPNQAHSLFTEVSRYTRGQARVEALTIAGIAAFIGHQGSLAMAALKAAVETAVLMDPPFHSVLLELVSDAYFSGVRPEEFHQSFVSIAASIKGDHS